MDSINNDIETSFCKRRILMIGPSPDSIGGVGVHLKRLIMYLPDNYIVDVINDARNKGKIYFNFTSWRLIHYLKMFANIDIVHIHSGLSIFRFFHIIVGRLLHKKVIVTVHRDVFAENFFDRLLDSFSLSLCDAVIYVNRKSLQFKTISSNTAYYVKEAFLPPEIENEPQLPDALLSIINKVKDDNRKLLVSNAFRLDIMPDGSDLYGLGFCIDFAEQVKLRNENYTILFVIANPKANQELILHYQEIIKNKHLENQIVLYLNSISFVRLVEYSDVVVRATATDGDALTIREALYLGKPVVASNVVSRPIGTIEYNYGDLMDFYAKVQVASRPSSFISHKQIDLSFYTQLYSRQH